VLFDPNAHERLTEESWEPGRVYAALREIVEDAEGAFDNGWPTHPQDSEQDSDEERRFRTVYMGGAGVVQALDSLQRRGLLELRGDYAPYLEQRYEPDFPGRGSRAEPLDGRDGDPTYIATALAPRERTPTDFTN